MSSRPTTAAATREAFLAFFEKKGHTRVPSAPLVPQDDPTLLFTNAGMNQFKDVFLGTGTRPYLRAVDTQKCLRVSGKHNDLEEVGIDTYHHTFFEMLGNWSFGDYFKAEAIPWAWELLVDHWGLDPNRLYATVHSGDAGLGLAPDDEAAEIWRTGTTIPPAHVLPGDTKDNFWMMGDTGPCGPCSEIHYDSRSDAERAATPGEALVNAGHPQVIEIWNNVFIQYNALGEGRLEPLPNKHVDTGMGFERICAVLQGKTSNYDIDLFQTLLADIHALRPAGAPAYADADERTQIAMRVVADHIRTLVFAIADGAIPGNAGRGYVIRRILRRAVRYGYQALDFREPFLHRLVGPVGELMGEAFPEIVAGGALIERTIRSEEEGFLRTLAGGLDFFGCIRPYVGASGAATSIETDRRAMDLLQKAYPGRAVSEVLADFRNHASGGSIPGEVAFLLHDTYGFPSDLTELMAREEGLTVDHGRFEELMSGQRDRARAAGQFGVDHSQVDTWDATSDTPDEITFVGYDTMAVDDARILRTRRRGDDRFEVVLDRTPFYAESGGQVGDTGTLTVGDETIQVLDTRKSAEGVIVHVVDRLPADRAGAVRAEVDAGRRRPIMRHHTATHLLHEALRETLGTHVQQRGSLVAPDRLRFDFAHFDRVTPEEQRVVERRVNEIVLRNLPLGEERAVPIEEARSRGAMALFGEKYGDLVRVISFVDESGDAPFRSVELCGGTHVAATGEVGFVRIVSEGSVASGIRRIEAVAGEAALAWLDRELEDLESARGRFKPAPARLADAVAAVQDEARVLAKSLAEERRKQSAGDLDTLLAGAREVDGIRLVTGRFDGTDMDGLRDLAEVLRGRLGSGVAVLGGADTENGKAYLAAAVTDDLLARVQAGKLIGVLAKRVGGGGGGRPALATAGGRQPENLDEALAAVDEEILAALRAEA